MCIRDRSSSSSDSELAGRLSNGIDRLQWLVNTPEAEALGSGSAFGDDQTISNVLDELDLELNYLLGLTGSDSSGILFNEDLEGITIKVNTQETVFSKSLTDDSDYDNREIKTLSELSGDVFVSGQDVLLYQELQRLEEQGEGLVVGSTRTIGSVNTSFTNLIRSGDTVSASTTWENTGNSETNNIEINGISNANATFVSGSFSGSLTTDDLTGGTFTISNGGVFGSMLSTPIINPPQSGILGMHNIIQRPIAVDGEIEIRPMMYLALSYDHRIIDGNQSVGFLIAVKEGVEDPENILMDGNCLLYTSPSPRDLSTSRMPSSA